MIPRTFALSLIVQMGLVPLARADDAPLAIPVNGAPAQPSLPPAQPPPPPPQPLAIPGNAAGYAPPPAVAGTAPTYGKGLADGEEAAREHKVVDWAGLGAAGGCLGPEVCLGVTAVGALMSPNPPPIYFQGLNNQDPTDNDYWNGYREGYDRKLRSRRAVAAFAGGAATTAVALAALVVLVGVTGAEIGPTYY